VATRKQNKYIFFAHFEISFSQIPKFSQKKKGCWNSREQTGTGGLFLANLELSWFQMVLKDEAGTREARKLGISGTEFRFGKQLGSVIASGSEVMN
jgi:hypothetical protein